MRGARITRRRAVPIGASLALCLSAAALAHAGMLAGSETTIYACKHVPSGLLRVVHGATSCGKHEQALSWNTEGPAGPAGPAGAAGAQASWPRGRNRASRARLAQPVRRVPQDRPEPALRRSTRSTGRRATTAREPSTSPTPSPASQCSHASLRAVVVAVAVRQP